MSVCLPQTAVYHLPQAAVPVTGQAAVPVTGQAATIVALKTVHNNFFFIIQYLFPLLFFLLLLFAEILFRNVFGIVSSNVIGNVSK